MRVAEVQAAVALRGATLRFGDRVLWGMTLRLLDDLVPRLLAGEWDV